MLGDWVVVGGPCGSYIAQTINTFTEDHAGCCPRDMDKGRNGQILSWQSFLSAMGL